MLHSSVATEANGSWASALVTWAFSHGGHCITAVRICSTDSALQSSRLGAWNGGPSGSEADDDDDDYNDDEEGGNDMMEPLMAPGRLLLSVPPSPSDVWIPLGTAAATCQFWVALDSRQPVLCCALEGGIIKLLRMKSTPARGCESNDDDANMLQLLRSCGGVAVAPGILSTPRQGWEVYGTGTVGLPHITHVARSFQGLHLAVDTERGFSAFHLSQHDGKMHPPTPIAVVSSLKSTGWVSAIAVEGAKEDAHASFITASKVGMCFGLLRVPTDGSPMHLDRLFYEGVGKDAVFQALLPSDEGIVLAVYRVESGTDGDLGPEDEDQRGPQEEFSATVLSELEGLLHGCLQLPPKFHLGGDGGGGGLKIQVLEEETTNDSTEDATGASSSAIRVSRGLPPLNSLYVHRPSDDEAPQQLPCRDDKESLQERVISDRVLRQLGSMLQPHSMSLAVDHTTLDALKSNQASRNASGVVLTTKATNITSQYAVLRIRPVTSIRASSLRVEAITDTLRAPHEPDAHTVWAVDRGGHRLESTMVPRVLGSRIPMSVYRWVLTPPSGGDAPITERVVLSVPYHDHHRMELCQVAPILRTAGSAPTHMWALHRTSDTASESSSIQNSANISGEPEGRFFFAPVSKNTPAIPPAAVATGYDEAMALKFITMTFRFGTCFIDRDLGEINNGCEVKPSTTHLVKTAAAALLACKEPTPAKTPADEEEGGPLAAMIQRIVAGELQKLRDHVDRRFDKLERRLDAM